MAQLVEHNLAKVGVAGSSPVVRSIWAFSSGGERFPDTEEVRSSNLLTPTKCSQLRGFASGLFCFCHKIRHKTDHQNSTFLIEWGYLQYSFEPLHKSYKCIKLALLRIYEIAPYLYVNYGLRLLLLYIGV